jgi:two-component system, OmpR family, sensor kinase
VSAIPAYVARRRLELGWGAFAALNLGAMAQLAGEDGGTIPFHFIWVSLTLVYGFVVWRILTTVVVLVSVMILTAAAILYEVAVGPTRPDELTEVPLMAAMFLAMVWHARRRLAAQREAVRLREREHEFIRDSSHHLKTPIQVARAYAELLREANLDPGADRDAQRLLAELDRMTGIVDRLLLLMHTDQPEPLVQRPVDLSEVCEDAVARWQQAADRSFTFVDPGPTWIVGDADRLAIALDALIENSVAATAQGGRIALILMRGAGTVTLEVGDDGVGLPAQSRDRVFDRFWSAPTGSSRRGTGLGLSIVKAIVEAHGGTVTLRSGTGGTAVAMRVPAGVEGPLDGLSRRLVTASRG